MKNELKYAKMWEGTGLERNHVEVYLEVIEGAMRDELATIWTIWGSYWA